MRWQWRRELRLSGCMTPHRPPLPPGWQRRSQRRGALNPMHGFLHVIPRLRWQDGLDVLIVAYVIYRLALLIRGTRTMQMVVGLGILAAAFVTSQMLGLFTLNWLLNNFLGSLIVILVVIFQADIRRALTGVGARSLFGTRANEAGVAQEITVAASWLSA